LEHAQFAAGHVGEDATESRQARMRTEFREKFLNFASPLQIRVTTGAPARRRSAGDGESLPGSQRPRREFQTTGRLSARSAELTQPPAAVGGLPSGLLFTFTARTLPLEAAHEG